MSGTLHDKLYTTSEEAEKAFYFAFEKSDYDLMRSIWADGDNIVCIHPMSDRLSGTEEVLESWQSMFKQPLSLAITIAAQSYNISPTLAVHSVEEHLMLVENNAMQKSVIHATNIYELINDSWHMILHHASPSRQPQIKQTLHSDAVH
ncbi:MAG: nuclear transport factor 2 family protein [Gammaproteobacteria bacterium]|nr:nuclear transport factor 2 family protein [Gammaproteobacteria bacterium]